MTFSGLIVPTIEASKEAIDWTKLAVANIVEKGADILLDFVSFLGTFSDDILANIGSFFTDMLHSIDQSVVENGLAIFQLSVQSAEYFADLSYSLIQSLASVAIGFFDLLINLADLLLTPVKDIAFLCVSLLEYVKELISFVSGVGEYVTDVFYILKGYVIDLFSFTLDIVSYVQEPFGSAMNALDDILVIVSASTMNFMSNLKQPLSNICATLSYVRSLIAMLPMLLKELISCVLLALVYLRQLLSNLPVLLLKWELEEQKVISSMGNSFSWGKQEEQAPRLISETVRRWWTTG